MKLINAFAIAAIFLAAPVAAENCTGPLHQQSAGCDEPGSASGKWKSIEAKARFERECTWLPFPVGKVAQPVVFFTQESDARCIGVQYRRSCPDCTAWIRPDRPRGPVNGPAANAVIAVRLHNGLAGVSVPRDAIGRIKRDGAWCDYGVTPAHASNPF